ncbi:MAG: hypothetical protein GEV05_18695 [Betaproteobacteria bacterium]|nr:hypothetical protein [Betaproteobacteria bacterium]
MRRSRVLLFALFLSASTLAPAAGSVIQATPETYLDRVRTLRAGDTLELAPGQYRDGLRIHHLAGTAQAPIVIRGPTGSQPALFVARSGANTVSIVDSSHIHIRDLTLDGRGIAVDAVKAEGHASYAHHITLENLTIVGHGASQQNVAISTKCPAWGWIIRGNRIHAAGTGMYLGNSDGSAPFYAGVIEYNLVTDPRGYAIQIKHQRARPALDIAPRGRHVTVIRHNVLSKAAGGSPGPAARPNLLLGHWPLEGEGSQDRYLVYGNFIADNPHEALIQAEGNVAIYNNVLRNPYGPGIHIQPHNDVPREVSILLNTIIASGNPIVVRMSEGPSTHTQVVASNAVFSAHAISGKRQEHNAIFRYEEAVALLSAGEQNRPFDPYPRDERLRCPRIDAQLIAALPEAACDFNGRRRTIAYCGAYAGSGRNPGWLPALRIKPRTICARQ